MMCMLTNFISVKMFFILGKTNSVMDVLSHLQVDRAQLLAKGTLLF